MATKILLAKSFRAFRPADADAEEFIDSLSENEIVEADIQRKRKSRSLAHNRKFWALMNVVHANQFRTDYKTTKALVNAIKICLGHADIIELPSGARHSCPNSISFAKMDQREFEAFYDAVVHLVLTEFLPGIGSAALEREVTEIMLGRRAA